MERDDLIEPYRLMYAHTKKACDSGCPLSGNRCCDELYCELTRKWAYTRWGVLLEPTGHPTLPFMGPDGCVAEPHHRTLCTVHYCGTTVLGNNTQTPEWNEKYFDLRELLSDGEMEVDPNIVEGLLNDD